MCSRTASICNLVIFSFFGYPMPLTRCRTVQRLTTMKISDADARRHSHQCSIYCHCHGNLCHGNCQMTGPMWWICLKVPTTARQDEWWDEAITTVTMTPVTMAPNTVNNVHVMNVRAGYYVTISVMEKLPWKYHHRKTSGKTKAPMGQPSHGTLRGAWLSTPVSAYCALQL